MKPLLLVLTEIQNTKTRSLVTMVLEGAGHRVIEAAGRAQTHTLVSNGLRPDLLICETPSDSATGTASCRELLQFTPAGSICLIAKVGEQDLYREASELGIKRILTAPVTREDLESVIAPSAPAGRDVPMDRVAVCGSLPDVVAGPCDSAVLQSVLEDMPALPYVEELGGNNFFLAASPAMSEIHRQVKLLADIDVNVLVLGESGTGKEIVAQLIHKNSRRSREKFLKVNCAALPAELLESELFGHRQGAFTGAINDRPGKFEQANRGTLLLDEIGEIGVQMQAKLLHVLQDGQFARLGAQQTTKVDVRVLAATNVQIEDALLNRTFREDLYYRLSVFTIKVPPLRERREEIPYLIDEFIRRSPAEMINGFANGFPSRLMDVVLLYDWRGNVRELRNFVTRTIIMRDADSATRELEAKLAASGAADSPDRPSETRSQCVGIRSIVRDVKARAEAQMIQSALENYGWNRRRAAQYLNISYRSLLYKIQQHRLKPWPAADVQASFPEETRSTHHQAV
ncbi:MAG: sigma-54 dependent transcriptional regulator [Terracidiphilus sp.]